MVMVSKIPETDQTCPYFFKTIKIIAGDHDAKKEGAEGYSHYSESLCGIDEAIMIPALFHHTIIATLIAIFFFLIHC